MKTTYIIVGIVILAHFIVGIVYLMYKLNKRK